MYTLKHIYIYNQRYNLKFLTDKQLKISQTSLNQRSILYLVKTSLFVYHAEKVSVCFLMCPKFLFHYIFLCCDGTFYSLDPRYYSKKGFCTFLDSCSTFHFSTGLSMAIFKRPCFPQGSLQTLLLVLLRMTAPFLPPFDPAFLFMLFMGLKVGDIWQSFEKSYFN